ncbi:MAG: mycofactocin-coupled SDR family oxidoreductase [Clostridiales bacterium]|jgi:NAD(P)-dependent dehydrogenase (short-subunit alcohol dehydrogenase family)|nr:mycofactocin-coupled SDR family oxidoreductase [Clostridiales bacterium]
MYGFKDKTVFITGAAKGQGRAVALAFAKEGANIIAFDLAEKIPYPIYNDASKHALVEVKKEIEAVGGKAYIYAGDVRNADDIRAAVEGGVSCFGKIDVLFNNAGICAYGYSHELTEEQWDAMIDINLKGAWLAGKYVIPVMRAQRSGVIINNSSVGGLRGMNRLSHYAASKWALVGLTKSWALENTEYGIRVISIHPTGVNSPMNDGLAFMEGATPEEIAVRSAGNLIPVPWIEPEDVADSVLFLASDKAKYVTGSQYVLDAGLLTR